MVNLCKVSRVSSLALALALVAAPTTQAEAQDTERPPGQGGGYAWGDGGSTETTPTGPDDPLRIAFNVGAGMGFRPLRNLDFNQDFTTPAYMDIGGAVYLPGRDIRHGFGMQLNFNLTSDSGQVDAGTQWGFTPSYYLLLPLDIDGWNDEWFAFRGRVGLPIVISGTPSADVSFGLEVGVAFIVKFLAGFGVYLEAQAAGYGGANLTVHPVIAFDAGLVVDYEVLP